MLYGAHFRHSYLASFQTRCAKDDDGVMRKSRVIRIIKYGGPPSGNPGGREGKRGRPSFLFSGKGREGEKRGEGIVR